MCSVDVKRITLKYEKMLDFTKDELSDIENDIIKYELNRSKLRKGVFKELYEKLDLSIIL